MHTITDSRPFIATADVLRFLSSGETLMWSTSFLATHKIKLIQPTYETIMKGVCALPQSMERRMRLELCLALVDQSFDAFADFRRPIAENLAELELAPELAGLQESRVRDGQLAIRRVLMVAATAVATKLPIATDNVSAFALINKVLPITAGVCRPRDSSWPIAALA